MDETLQEAIPPSLRDELLALWSQLSTFGTDLLQPGWKLWQVLIVLALIAAAFLMKKWAADRMTAWMRTLHDRPKWQLRALVIFRNRLGLMIFAVLAWAVYLTMQQITWPSRSYLIGLAATIGTAWVAVSYVARIVRNPFLRTIVTWGLWIWVTLFYLGILDETQTALDSIAFEVGDIRISVLGLLTALVLIGLLFTVARFVSTTTAARVQRNEDLSPSMRVLVVKIVQIILYAGAFFLGLKAVGVDLTGLAVLSGAIGVGLGFGLQKVISNLVSGVIILLDKSIKPGDVISIGETFGWVTTLTARYVSITTRDGKEYLIPNEDLITGQVVNWSHSNDFVRLDIFFGTAYGDDPHAVRRIAVEAAKSVERVLSVRAPVCHIVGFGDSSVDYILRFWIADPTGGLTNIRGNVYLALWDAFQENGISIPFPQREVKVLDSVNVKGPAD
ncbi:mechanosensitive ion channel family protein [Jannaschia aquimarina]|uniref:Putative MscS family protein.1 n=1 Tax=Jannaschia aquimarina TaxID=935700 RepID=A0A0D1EHL5_9RHOB|nr:mechanosensitive ion channel domain-containing protein [Jannaschia aquimarina]KIT16336.1 putative MscS family protein.1 precursor [Jannaschia aquimarina]SNT25992.1 Mechanosensitive ion channel [Jannaschia aquimarina]